MVLPDAVETEMDVETIVDPGSVVVTFLYEVRVEVAPDTVETTVVE